MVPHSPISLFILFWSEILSEKNGSLVESAQVTGFNMCPFRVVVLSLIICSILSGWSANILQNTGELF